MSQRIRHAADLRFVRQVLAGDPDARAQFVERMACIPAILRAKQRRFSLAIDPLEHEELVQSILTAIWRKLPDFEGSSALETWAYGFCTNELLRWRERGGRNGSSARSVPLEELEEDLSDRTREPEVDAEQLQLALARLGPPGSTIVHLKHFEELTFDEIGRRLEIPANTAKTQYYRGVRKLREILRPCWGREEA